MEFSITNFLMTYKYMCFFNSGGPADRARAVKQIQDFISEICSWMVVNKLKLNPSKTDFIILQLKHHFRKHGEFQIKVGEAVIQRSSTVRNFGFYMDRYNSCEAHVNSLCKRISFHINCRAGRFFTSCYFTIC